MGVILNLTPQTPQPQNEPLKIPPRLGLTQPSSYGKKIEKKFGQ